ncbi:histone-fold-containing protein [Kockovaella imperatae]|uniref:Histone-fold-containing protein n=1 Tax=Kockovaella imperatae TaxID=4999 RepID=A0A1Y1UP26_9TREE|nr:histone-fold-containing protein [Kockovaella imperatae]ORX39297.1 histone-fold-containing protein [Kockovaella imperatae]
MSIVLKRCEGACHTDSVSVQLNGMASSSFPSSMQAQEYDPAQHSSSADPSGTVSPASLTGLTGIESATGLNTEKLGETSRPQRTTRGQQNMVGADSDQSKKSVSMDDANAVASGSGSRSSHSTSTKRSAKAAARKEAAHLQSQDDLNEFLEEFWTKQITLMEEEDVSAGYALPLARIKKVMKSDEDVKMISAEVPIMFSKACEIFIAELTCRAWLVAESQKRRTLQKSDVAAAIACSDMFDFLIDIVPRDDVEGAGGGTGGAGTTGTANGADEGDDGDDGGGEDEDELL